MMPRQKQRLLLPVWKQEKVIISKEYAPLGAKALILVNSLAASFPSKGEVAFLFLNVDFGKLSLILFN